jgi:hypothetical protein
METYKKIGNYTFKLTSKYNIGDEIFYQNMKWSYKDEKNIITKEKAKIVDMYDYDNKNWGTLNVRVIPKRKELWDKDGGRWISENDIISKVGG